jgi:ketosteroid isomerase-like protein
MANNHVPQPAAPHPAELADHVAAFTAAFRTGSAERLDDLYEARGLLVPKPGHPVTGAARVAANRHLLGMGGELEAHVRHGYVAGDIALLIVDWSIHGTRPDGVPLRLGGTAADVARRGADGTWRYVIDNPFGTAT